MKTRNTRGATAAGRDGTAALLILVAVLIVVAVAITANASLAAANHRPPASRRTSGQSAKQEIIQIEHRWLEKEYNPGVLKKILAPDFVHVLPQGFISRQEQIAFVRAHVQPNLSVHKFGMLRVRVYENVAIANGIVEALPSGGKTLQKIFFTDVFALRNGRWQAVNAQETPAAANSK